MWKWFFMIMAILHFVMGISWISGMTIPTGLNAGLCAISIGVAYVFITIVYFKYEKELK